ncbi:TolC family protein [Marivirga sp.]|uniref:TolC family protein n=1 Tax=Marivirga sp. TaxID=2018662 RepID=UPI0025DE9A6D|nr:TolC family protein [Marivirga sp.]
MKKTILTLAILIMVSLNATSQSIDYNKIILPKGISDISYEEKLVQIAWNNHPSNDEVKKSVALAKYDLKIGKLDWLDAFKASANLNEFNIDPSSDIANRSLFFPRYNFSLSLPLGQLFTDPMVTKKNHIKVEMAESRVNNVKIQLRKEVLSAYNNYLMFEEIYKIQSIALEDSEMNHSIIEESFKQGEETYDKYSASNTQISQRKISRLQAFNDMQNAKLVLESLIGIPLEDVM